MKTFDRDKFINKINNLKRKDLGKILSKVDDFTFEETYALWESFDKLDQIPKVIGLVGNPGAGKSTYLNQVLNIINKDFADKKIGLLLIDPSNPNHGGSILGDRIRLSDHFLNLNFFIRSISNSSAQNGLNPNLDKYLMILSHCSFDVIFVESVGTGQANTEINQYTHDTCLIFDPSSGDTIQHLKEGVLTCVNEIIISKTENINSEGLIESIKNWSNQSNVWPLPVSKDRVLSILDQSDQNNLKLKTNIHKKVLIGKLFHDVQDLTNSYFKNTPKPDQNAQSLKAYISENL